MSLNYYSKNRFFHFVVVCIVVALSSCTATKSFVQPDFKKPVSYNKVKIDISSGFIGGGLLGYIYLIPDTQICFRLWGPWGYEIGKGTIYPSKIAFYNEINDALVPDLKAQIENLSGCVLDLRVFQSLLVGNVDGFIEALNQLNPDLLSAKVNKGSRRSTIQITHKVNHSEMNVYFFYKKGQLRNMLIKFKKDKSYSDISFDFGEISNERKICTFAF
jgi:hypothetical protein